jgi:murein DD-endopeptidase MepM/ murein hydrolase activator NlpD
MRFDSPVGAQAERDGATIWPGAWIDATGYNVMYTATGSPAYHTGADLNLNKPWFDADAHSPVYAVADGLCCYAEVSTAWGAGNAIVVTKHTDRGRIVYARYAHVENIKVRAGDAVARGQQLAQIGSGTGRYPYHLHFDLARVDLCVYPADWPGASSLRVVRDYYDPLVFLREHHADPKVRAS